jgi:hypothetical protein
VTEQFVGRQRLSKHGIKAGTTAEVEVKLLGNGNQTPVWAETNIKRHSRDNKQNNRRQLTVRHGDLYSDRLQIIKGEEFARQSKTRVEAGSNISTVARRIVGGDEKGSVNLRQ